MPVIEMRVIERSKVAHHRGRKATRNERSQAEQEQDIRFFNRWKRAEARQREEFTHAGSITHCSRCPPKRHRRDELRFCPDCARINAARFRAGLIRPPVGEQVDHANNIIDPTVKGTYRGQSRCLIYRHSAQHALPVTTAHIKQLGGGWRRGLASLNGSVVWEGPKTRSMDEAWAYAHEHVELIREGLRYEGKL